MICRSLVVIPVCKHVLLKHVKLALLEQKRGASSQRMLLLYLLF